uniref:NADH-ubiquinone oxidoreductase chain 2 n=1 Tax=Heteropsylla cubana TaxID=121849 RepID=A0A344A2D1_9HEMI|nr:NADH dehydrogenase subunit 2 [Heteropsylla sp. DMP-2018]AWU48922.1 NADH dehydrogenase subunit 2 [Heteropsylla sp. DMP-2018]
MKNYFWILSPLYLISILFAISSYSWMMMWIGMEMNLLIFLFIMLKSKMFNSSESSMKYYMIQAVGSVMFVFSISTQKIYFSEYFLINALVPPLALMMKSGTAPFHAWTPEIALNMNFTSLFLFLTMQKIIPLLIICSSWNYWLMWIILINMLVGAVGGISQSSINKMLVYSSINNIGWILMSSLESLFMFYFYFFIYLMLNMYILIMMSNMKIKWISQIKSQNIFKKISYGSLMISFSGLPPFMGFIPKWIILKKMCSIMPLTSILSILISVFSLFFYMKMSTKMLLSSSFSKKWKIKTKNSCFIILVINLCSFPLFFMLT